jgi:hypothetical protein
MSSTSDLKAGWRRGKQGGIYRPVDGGGGAAHRKWRRRGGDHQWNTRWGTISPWCTPHASFEWGKRRKDGMGSLGKGACERHTSEKRNERGGVRYGNEGEKSRADTSAGEKRSVQCKGVRRVRRHAAAMRARLTWVRPPMAPAGHTVTVTRQV